MIQNTLHILLARTLPPLLLGVIGKTKALFAGRVGPPVLQPYYDLIKLFQKGSVFSTTTTWVFRAGPVVGLVSAVLVVLLIPLGNSSVWDVTENGSVTEKGRGGERERGREVVSRSPPLPFSPSPPERPHSRFDAPIPFPG